MWAFRSVLILFVNFIMFQCCLKIIYLFIFNEKKKERKKTEGTVAELFPSPFASTLPGQHRELILYQGHFFFRTPVILHQSQRTLCYLVFSLFKISAAMLSLLTFPFQFSHYINFVLWAMFWKTLHFCKCENANHITEQIPLLGEFSFSSQALELTLNLAF